MKKSLKIVLGLVGALLLLVVVAAAAALIFIDPNDYRDTIASQVEEQTGRQLKIEGELHLSLFPWLGLELGAMELGNAPGFEEKPFARIEAAEARVKLLPLLKLKTEIDTVLLRGLELNLHRRSNGVSNWDDLAGGGGEAVPAEEKPQEAEASAKVEQVMKQLAIGGILLEEANIDWQDDMTQRHFALSHLNFRTGTIRIAQPIPMELSVDMVSSQPELKGSVKFAGKLSADPIAQRFAASDMMLESSLQGAVVPGGKIRAKVAGSAVADLKAQTASARDLSVAARGVELKITADASQILGELSFSGKLASGEFVPRDLLAGLGIELPQMVDPSAMSLAKLESRFEGGLDRIVLDDLSARLDDTTLSGSASVANFSAPQIRYQLKVDGIDADRYLPPPSEQPAAEGAATASAQAAAPTELPLALLRSLDIDGTLKVDKVKVMNLHSDSIVATVKAKDGRFRVHPLSAKLYEGGYSGDLGFDVSGKQPRLSMNEKLSGVQSGPLMQDFLGKPWVTGEANMAAKLTAVGLEPMAVRKSLNGNGSFSFKDGTVNGINLGQLIRKAYALYKKQPTPPEEDKKTDFANVSGSFNVKNGLVSTSDLSARSPLFQVAGRGKVNLGSEKLDLRLDTTIVSDIRDATGENMGDLRGEKIPVTITGSFSDPKFGVDVASILEAKAKAEVEKKKKEVEQKVQKEVDKKKKEIENDLQDKLKNMLKF